MILQQITNPSKLELPHPEQTPKEERVEMSEGEGGEELEGGGEGGGKERGDKGGGRKGGRMSCFKGVFNTFSTAKQIFK